MEFDEQSVQDYLKEQFQGRQSFLEHIIFPIFGEESFEDGYNTEQIDSDSFREAANKIGIRSIIRYGWISIDLGSIQIFDITVTDHVLLARNRVAVQGIIRRILGTFQGAFMIFHYDDTERWDWRFSFCCKGEKDVTEAKRFTFLLGPNQSCRTAAQNFVKLAASTSSSESPTMDNIRKAFDVEALSDEFFAKYKDRYEKIVKYITGKCFKKIGGKWKEVSDGVPNEPIYNAFGRDDKAVRDYVKKLLGRIVFLHFLQKKGWLGARRSWADGDREFMLHLYLKSSDEQKNDFLESVLEPLFDKALDDDRASKGDLFDTHVSGIGKVKIPYLNGGLFTRDAADEKTVRLPREFFCEFLVFLSEYNFTIDENDPSDAEVGVDPEMLSRIFENLLEDNKDKGAIYTPKPIVEYMCRQSLIAYLKTDMPEAEHVAIEKFVKTYDPSGLTKKTASTIDKRLKSVKICDPAIGSGAFPMGMLRELYFCRTALEEDLGELRPTEIKRQIIQQNIYGVDIEKGAVDIARLRFWLALVVDEPTPHTLPNLDFKIMQGNSLLESYKGVPLDSLLAPVGRSPRDRRSVGSRVPRGRHTFQPELAFGGDSASKAITSLIDEYYSTDNREGKQRILNAINDQVKGYIKGQISNSELNAEIDALECQNDKFFLWHTWFADVFARGGFDIVIGNPPYIQLQANSGELANLYQWCGFATFERTGDIYCLFYEFGWQLLASNGHLCYITSNKWLRSGYGARLRKFFVERTQPMKLLDFAGEKIFEAASVDTNILLLASVPSQPSCRNDAGRAVLKMPPSATTSLACVATPECRTDIGRFFDAVAHRMVFCVDDIWRIMSEKEEMVFNKIRDLGTPLVDWKLQINYGIKTGYNDAFIVDDAVRGRLVSEDRRSAELLLPYVKGQHAERYWHEDSGKWLVATHNGYGDVPRIDVVRYPAIKKWLDSHEPELSERTDQGDTPYNLRSCAYWGDFSKPKILWAETMRIRRKTEERFPRFTYVGDGLVADKTCFFATGKSLKYLVGVMNSLVGWYLCRQCVSILDKGGYMMQKAFVEKIPVLQVSSAQQKPIIALVDKILALKKSDSNADTSALESQIDDLVFDLYGLEESERDIIRQSVK